jgi:hypothetical protein
MAIRLWPRLYRCCVFYWTCCCVLSHNTIYCVRKLIISRVDALSRCIYYRLKAAFQIIITRFNFTGRPEDTTVEIVQPTHVLAEKQFLSRSHNAYICPATYMSSKLKFYSVWMLLEKYVMYVTCNAMSWFNTISDVFMRMIMIMIMIMKGILINDNDNENIIN